MNKTLNYNLAKVDASAGYTNKLYQNENTSITAGARTYLSGVLNITPSFEGQVRLGTDVGVKAENDFGNFAISNEASIGVIGDYLKSDYGKQTPGIAPGVKTNIQTSAVYIPSNNVQFKATGGAFLTKSNNLTHTGFTGGVQASYNSDNNVMYAGVSGRLDSRAFSVGGFEDVIKDNSITAYGGIQLSKTVDIFGSYTHEFRDKSNFFSSGVKYTF